MSDDLGERTSEPYVHVNPADTVSLIGLVQEDLEASREDRDLHDDFDNVKVSQGNPDKQASGVKGTTALARDPKTIVVKETTMSGLYRKVGEVEVESYPTGRNATVPIYEPVEFRFNDAAADFVKHGDMRRAVLIACGLEDNDE